MADLLTLLNFERMKKLMLFLMMVCSMSAFGQTAGDRLAENLNSNGNTIKKTVVPGSEMGKGMGAALNSFSWIFSKDMKEMLKNVWSNMDSATIYTISQEDNKATAYVSDVISSLGSMGYMTETGEGGQKAYYKVDGDAIKELIICKVPENKKCLSLVVVKCNIKDCKKYN